VDWLAAAYLNYKPPKTVAVSKEPMGDMASLLAMFGHPKPGQTVAF
jgi:hypothetical protein